MRPSDRAQAKFVQGRMPIPAKPKKGFNPIGAAGRVAGYTGKSWYTYQGQPTAQLVKSGAKRLAGGARKYQPGGWWK